LSAQSSEENNRDNIEVATITKQGSVDSRSDTEADLKRSSTSLAHSIVHEQEEEGEPSFNISTDKNKFDPPSEKDSSSRYDNEIPSDSSSIQTNPFMTNKSQKLARLTQPKVKDVQPEEGLNNMFYPPAFSIPPESAKTQNIIVFDDKRDESHSKPSGSSNFASVKD